MNVQDGREYIPCALQSKSELHIDILQCVSLIFACEIVPSEEIRGDSARNWAQSQFLMSGKHGVNSQLYFP